MIQAINGYKIDTDISSYGDSLCPFGRQGYEWAREIGRQPFFKGEKYYWVVEDRNFLGRECGVAMVSAINGKIYKISYHFHDTQADDCVAIREATYNFIARALGEHTEIQEVDSDHKVILWQTKSGNVILELDCLETELILTSNSVRNAKKISLFGRIFGKTGA